MEELLKQILKEIRKTNRRLEAIEDLLCQAEEDSDEEPEENKNQLLDGSFYNG